MTPESVGMVSVSEWPYCAPRTLLLLLLALELPSNYNGAYYAVVTWYKRRSEHPNSRPIKSFYGQCTFLFRTRSAIDF